MTLSTKRRTLLAAGAGLAIAAAGGLWWRSQRLAGRSGALLEQTTHPGGRGMRLRQFGTTALQLSEVGFGAWAIGSGYGAVQKEESLRALARAEELGCNFVDSAMVYGDSELVLGDFLQGRRNKWILSTKYSGQPEGLVATVEAQLRRMRTDVIDFYQIHWLPRGDESYLLDELYKLKKSGKIRFVGVSLYTAGDIRDVLDNPEIDGFQVAFNLLEPDPFLGCIGDIRRARKGIIIRSALREGFLTGKFRRDVTFQDPTDQRSKLSRNEIEHLVDLTEQFRFLEAAAGSMAVAAARYPLSFPEVSTVILGTKNEWQANSNFGDVPGAGLSMENLLRIQRLQNELGLGHRWPRLRRRLGLGA